MYESYYGLNELPFKLTANPRYLLLTPKHAEALNSIRYCVSSRRGIVVLTGDAGTGKSTILRAAVASTTGSRLVEVSDPSMPRAEFRKHLANGFGLRTTTEFVRALTNSLTTLFRQGVQTALLVDEAQLLPLDVLEDIRLLSNIEIDDEKLLPIVLAGQPELAARLNDSSLRQLKQRVALRSSLGPLELRETAAYIAGRVKVAGGEATTIFNKEAVLLIHACSRGIPRTVSVICDNAMMTGFAADQRPIGRDTVMQVCRDLDLEVPAHTVGMSRASVAASQKNRRLQDRETAANSSEPAARFPTPGATPPAKPGHRESFRRFLQSYRLTGHTMSRGTQ